MAPRTSWKGFLKLSLVSVPVKAYTANNTDEEIRLNQLHGECHGRVRYKKVCEAHGELKSEDIVSGYEYAKDQYVVIDEEELAKVRKKSDKAVSIDGFVAPEKIDPIYLAGRTYYLLPDGVAGNRPYALLVRGMVDANVVAIAQVVIAGREQLVMLRPQDAMLVMNVLNYPKRVRRPRRIATSCRTRSPAPASSRSPYAHRRLDPRRVRPQSYRDAYVENPRSSSSSRSRPQTCRGAIPRSGPNLMEVLKKSVPRSARARWPERAEQRPGAGPRRRGRARPAQEVPRKTG
jgi:DNA end-binding protein Ku